MLLDFTESKFRRWFRSFTAQPHQPFFVLGFTIFIYSIAVLPLVFTGIVQLDIGLFHTYNLTQLMPTCFFLGFLLTVLYRFLLVVPFLYKDYMVLFWLALSAFVVIQISFFSTPMLVVVGQFLLLCVQLFAMKIFIKAYTVSTAVDKRDSFLIILAFSMGAVANLLFMIANAAPQIMVYAKGVSFMLFLVGTVFVITQKMVVNFFGFYFERNPIVSDGYLIWTVLVAFVAVIFSVSTGYVWLTFVSNLTGLMAVLAMFFRQKVVFCAVPPILSILQVGIYWLMAAFLVGLLSCFLQLQYLLQVHVFALGFVGTMIIGFGSRVSLGHSGRKIESDRYTTGVFVAYQVAVVLRLVAVFEPSLLLPSAIGMSLVLAAWFYRYAPMLLKL